MMSNWLDPVPAKTGGAMCSYIECVNFGLFLLISDLDILLTYTYNLVSCVGLYLLVSKHSILSPLERELG